MLSSLLTSPLALRLVGAAVLAAVLGWGAYSIRHSGVAQCEAEHQAALAGHLQRAAEQAAEIARQDAEVSEYYERWRTREVERWHVQVEEVIRDIPTDCTKCGLSPDGLRALNDLRRPGTAAPAPSQPDSGMPTPDAAPQSAPPSPRGLYGPGQPHVQRLRGPAQSPGGASQDAGVRL